MASAKQFQSAVNKPGRGTPTVNKNARGSNVRVMTPTRGAPSGRGGRF